MKYFLVEVKPVVKYMKDYDDSLINHTESFYTQQKTAVAAKYVGSERVLGLTPKTDSEGNKLWKDPKATQVSEEEFIAHYEETQEQLPDLPQQESIDVAVIKLSETRRIEVAVREVGKDWLSSLELIDISEPSISEGNIRKFSDAKPNKEESVKSVMSKAGDLLFKLGDIPGGKHFYTGNLQEKFDIAVDYQIVVDIEPNESESSDFIPTDPYQKVIYNCLFCIDDAHLEFTEEQYQEAGANLETVIKEHQKHTKGFLTDATIEDLQKIDWDSGAEAQKTFLNIRHLRAQMRDCLVLVEDSKLGAIRDAIYERLAKREGSHSSIDIEVKQALADFEKHITEQSDEEKIALYIMELAHCSPLFSEAGIKDIVEQFTESKNEEKQATSSSKKSPG